MVKLLVFQKIVVPLHRVKEITQRPGPVPGKETDNETEHHKKRT